MKPDNFLDIVATLALYRPGPLQGGMVDAYVNCKHGREKPEYPHPVMEEILAETYGVMVYQEQVMRILNRLGGIELSSAYACIKAISKKKQEIIDQRRTEFLKGAVERGVGAEVARDIFEKIVYFGGYGFNKSHTAAYALIAYQTAFLKAHYTPEFMAALLSSEIEDGNKRDVMVDHIADARHLGVEVRPPDVNTSDAEFTVAGRDILFGLLAIKGLGRAATEEIVRARREGGPFRDLFDFCERIDVRTVSRVAVEKLIKAGAFDHFGRRAQLVHVLPRALSEAARLSSARQAGQLMMFTQSEEDPTGRRGASAGTEPLPDVPDWSETEKLKNEKEALDFYLSSHPLAQHGELLRRFSMYTVSQLAGLPANQEVVVGGMLTQVRFKDTKVARNGNSRFARLVLEDMTGQIECVMWPDDLVRHKDEVRDEHVCFVKATIDGRSTRDRPVLVLTRILSLEQAQRELTRGLVLLMTVGVHEPGHLDAVGRVLRRAPGVCPVFLTVRDGNGKRTLLKLGEEFRINPATVPTAELETILGTGCVKFSGPVNGNGRNGNGR
jgi:DNA polymerase-3 subunit alpha